MKIQIDKGERILITIEGGHVVGEVSFTGPSVEVRRIEAAALTGEELMWLSEKAFIKVVKSIRARLGIGLADAKLFMEEEMRKQGLSYGNGRHP